MEVEVEVEVQEEWKKDKERGENIIHTLCKKRHSDMLSYTGMSNI